LLSHSSLREGSGTPKEKVVDGGVRAMGGFVGTSPLPSFHFTQQGRSTMKKLLLMLMGLALCAPHAQAAQKDVVAPIIQFIEGFNTGDTKSAFAAYATGEITIIDEFAPHVWMGPKAAQDWAAEYDKHALATGVTDGKVTYSAPTRVEVEGDVAYVVMPTLYVYKEHGKPMAEKGQITAVLNKQAGAWKMRGWTWAGVKPHPAS
jgi:ketosteroid isomerase-like protein